jgi:hypothetical protein
MKKILAIFLALVVTGTAFADFTTYGRIRTNFGVDIPIEPDGDSAWAFLPHARLGVRRTNDTSSFFLQLDFGPGQTQLANWRANATVKLGEDVTLSIGQDELPWVRWSSLAHFGNLNSGFGASNTPINPYFRANFMGAYLGLTAARNTEVNTKLTTDFPFPGFFAGYEFNEETFSVGGAVAGLANNSGAEDVFSFMGKAHARFIVAPATIGVNLAFYMAPEFGFFNIPGLTGTSPAAITSGKDAMVMEAMFDVNFRLTPCIIGVSAAFVTNFADEEKGGGGSALRAGLSFNFDLGGGFRLIPGAMLTHYLKGAGAGGSDYKNSIMQAGVTFLYNF